MREPLGRRCRGDRRPGRDPLPVGATSSPSPPYTQAGMERMHARPENEGGLLTRGIQLGFITGTVEGSGRVGSRKDGE